MELDEARKQRPKYCVFFFNDTATTEIYTLSLHDALPIYDLLKAINARDAVADADDRADFVDRNSLFVVLNLLPQNLADFVRFDIRHACSVASALVCVASGL